MGKGKERPGHLSSTCPVCGRVVTARDLKSLSRAVTRHCSNANGPKAKDKRGFVAPSVTLPTKLVFDRPILSQNKTTYSHWTRYSRDKSSWLRYSYVFAPLRECYLPYSEWVLTRVYCPPKRLLDKANLVGGAKPLIDMLVSLGVIVDDNPLHFECDYRQVRGDTNRTELTLVRYDNAARSANDL